MRQITNNIELSAETYSQLIDAIRQLFKMHANLIEYYQKESELKKHHRAYLHVREEAEIQILHDLIDMDAIEDDLGQYVFGDMCPDCNEPENGDEENDPSVIMKLDDLYAMQKDMIDLTDAIDLMAKYYVATKYQAPVNKQKYDDTVHNAKSLANEVFTRWENSTIEEIK